MGIRYRILFWAVLGLSGQAIAQSDAAANTPSKNRMKLKGSAEASELPRVIKVERNTPVFSGPSHKKKILADVDAGTMLIARSLSPKSSWIYVEDEDGNKGWIPLNRTNYQSVSAPAETVADEDIDDAVQEEKSQEDERPPMDWLKVVEGQASNFGFGANASLMLLQKQASPFAREHRIGLQAGVYREWLLKASQERSYTVPVLIRMMARSAGSGFFSGPDLGAQYRSKSRSWGGEVGYSFGWGAKSKSGLQTRGRASIEWGGRTRYLATWGFGWVF